MSDPSNATPASCAERLAAALDAAGVTRVSSIDALLALTASTATSASQVSAGFALSPSIRVQEHHDIQPALFVYDPFLGTIGLVEILPRDAVCASQPSSTAPRVLEEVRAFIDRAAYFRQLCLLHAERAGMQAFNIELAIVFQREHPPEARADAASVLQKLSSETGYMRSIGVNLLEEDADGGFTQWAQAFPWLLMATRKWFASARMRRDTNSGENRPWSVELENYRHPGRRLYKLKPGRVHLLHGHNGSGKSSLCEALELLLTRAIERLDRKDKAQYFSFVRHRPAAAAPGSEPATPARVVLKVESDPRLTAEVEVHPPSASGEDERRHAWSLETVAPLPSAASFRLDQRLMDFVIQTSDGQRAALFLKAYFPGDQSALDAASAASAAANAAFDTLPKSIRDDAASSKVERGLFLRDALAWTRPELSAWQPRAARGEMLQMIASCLPVTADQLTRLMVLHTSLHEQLTRWQAAPTTIVNLEEELQKLDQCVTQVRSSAPATRRNLEVALPILRQFNAWRAVTQISREGTLRQALDKWLELQALVDLVAKHYDVTATLARARELGWKPAQEHAPLFADVSSEPTRVEFLKSCRDTLAQDRDAARAAVRAFTQHVLEAADVEGAPVVAAAPLHFTDQQMACLNQVGDWLDSTATPSGPPLGDVLRMARRDNAAATRGRSTIGAPGGLDAAIAEGEQLLEACRALEATTVGSAENYRACAAALEAFTALEHQERNATQTFFGQLERHDDEGMALVGALNELLALFKPAPWAYAGLTLQAVKRTGDAPERLALRRGNGDQSEAELLLNTAEMNTFTLALFLLCAPGLDNPLKLLVLDDPLQNMDEMTVSSLARGLGKVMRIYPEGWRVLGLFHGEEDVYRLRDEIRASVYRLPWVSPTTAPLDRNETVEAVEMHGTEGIELQNLSQIVAIRAKAAGVT